MNELPDDAEIYIRVKDVQHMFDLIVGSLDYGSGFLDTDDVNTTRRVAVMLGRDPMDGTPSSQARNYVHDFRPCPPPPESARGRFGPEEIAVWCEQNASTCRWCNTGKGAPIHGE